MESLDTIDSTCLGRSSVYDDLWGHSDNGSTHRSHRCSPGPIPGVSTISDHAYYYVLLSTDVDRSGLMPA